MYWSRSLYTEPGLTGIEPESSGSCIVLKKDMHMHHAQSGGVLCAVVRPKVNDFV